MARFLFCCYQGLFQSIQYNTTGIAFRRAAKRANLGILTFRGPLTLSLLHYAGVLPDDSALFCRVLGRVKQGAAFKTRRTVYPDECARVLNVPEAVGGGTDAATLSSARADLGN